MSVQSLAIKPKVQGVSRKRYTSIALLRYIVIDGQLVRARDATDEEFYHYVYDLLYQFFEEELKTDKNIVELRYMKTFNEWDWSNGEDRIKAINEFNAMNRARRTCGLPVIALFAEASR